VAVDPIRGAGDPQTRVAGAQTAELFEEHSRMVYGLCRALLRDPDDADDATQATFISAYKSLLGGSEVREPAAWLSTIARNECTARAHTRMREPLPLMDADLGHTQGPEAELDRKAVIEELQQAISELPEKQREAVVLRDLYGLHYTEVSAALGMSVASVESLLFRARRSLRVSLKPLASGALIVPLTIREGIAQALPGFTTAGAAGGGAASGAVGLGLLAKFTGVPVALKIAAGVVTVTATGSVAVFGAEQVQRQHPSSIRAHTQPQAAGAGVRTASESISGRRPFVPVFVRSGTGAADDNSGTEHTGRGRRGSDDDRGSAAGATAGDSGNDDSEHGSAPDGANDEDGGSTGARSGRDEDAGTATRSGHGGTKSGSKVSDNGGESHRSRESHSGSGSGGVEAPESGDELLGTDTSNSGSTGSDRSSGSDGSGSSDETRPDDSDAPSDDSPDAVTPPPPA